MIKDNLKNASLYAGMSPRIAKALEFAARGGLDGLAPGRYDIDGDELYVMVQHNTLRDWSEGKWEVHRRYADIQLLIRGSEDIGYQDASLLGSAAGYSESGDIEFLAEGEGAHLSMRAGDFAIFFPQDAHRPGMREPGAPEDAMIDIAVFKVLL